MVSVQQKMIPRFRYKNQRVSTLTTHYLNLFFFFQTTQTDIKTSLEETSKKNVRLKAEKQRGKERHVWIIRSSVSCKPTLANLKPSRAMRTHSKTMQRPRVAKSKENIVKLIARESKDKAKLLCQV